MTQDDRDLLIRIDERTAELTRVVIKGNGKPSLVDRVSGLELWRSMLLGAWLLAVAAITIYGAVKTK